MRETNTIAFSRAARILQPRLPVRRPLMMLDIPGFRIRETVYDAAIVAPLRTHDWASLCLTIDGGYRIDWGRTCVECGPATLVLSAPTQMYGTRISDAGSHCLTVDIDPVFLTDVAEGRFDWERINTVRRAPPHWLAFQLRQELQLQDDLSPTTVPSIVIALLVELNDRPALEARSTPPSWLKRVQERIHDEFSVPLPLLELARTAGVHRVHLIREFRRRFGCTVGHYIRQRRIEFACHRLRTSQDPLSVIGFDAGFSDQSHFTNAFRKLVGMSPGLFRTRFGAS